jgi:hypothetical protein
VDALGDAIGFEKQELAFGGGADGGAIIAGPKRLIRGNRNLLQQLVKQQVFGVGFHSINPGQ